EYVGVRSVQEMLTRASALREAGDRTEAVVGFIAEFFASSLFTAALELWAAARTDAELSRLVAPLEARLGRDCHRIAVDLLGADESRRGVREAVQATLDLARGLALANLLTDDSKRRRRVVRQWARMLADTLRTEAE